MPSIERTAIDIEAAGALIAMELDRTKATRRRAEQIEQEMDLPDNGDVHRAAVSLVKVLDEREGAR